jgi:ABC-type nitrate/sulfonate/bicarbonate transport system substrate-binding protein
MKKRNSIIAAIVFTALLAVSYFFFKDKITSKPALSHVKVGYLAHPGYLPLFCAEQNGYLETKHFKIDLIRFETSQAMSAAFSNGDIEIAPMSSATALSIESLEPGKFKVFALSSETVENYLTSILVSKKIYTNNFTISGLKGKKIGIFPGPASKVLFSMAFRKIGLEPGKDVILQELPPPVQLQALESGQVDALATYEPTSTLAVEKNLAVNIFPGAVEKTVLSPTQGGSWIISTSFLKNNQNTSEVLGAIYKGIVFTNENKNVALQVLPKYAKIDSAITGKIPLVKFSQIDENTDIISYQKYADIMFENGILSKRIDVSKILISNNDSK